VSRLALVALASALALCGCQKRGADAVKQEQEKRQVTPPTEEAASPSTTEPAGRGRGCSIELVRKAVLQHSEASTTCYRKALGRNPKLADGGKLAFELHIDATGRATRVSVHKDELGDAALAKCVEGVLRPIEYPLIDKPPCVVIYPYKFSASVKPRGLTP